MQTFTVINEAFTCKNCGAENSKLQGSCRNHCTKCLYSMHVDENFPGDRQSPCHGLMSPFAISKNSKKGWMIHHQCQLCDKKILNKAAEDDDIDEIIKLSKNPRYE